MVVGLNREGFEATLIHRPSPGGLVMGMPALRMGDGDPAEDFGEFPILPRPEEEMPVIWHQAIGGDADVRLGVGFSEDLFKGRIVGGLLKEREPADTAVQDVIGEVSGGEA